ncbi:MAG: hypothetical protein ACYC99_10305 [Candidatus Geothermincolia bacterium]
MSVKGKTVREFQFTGDVWGIADQWAAAQGYSLMAQDEASRLYQKGSGFWLAPQMVQLSVMPQGYVLQAWVHIPLINRIMTLGLMPEEMIVDKGGFVGVIPRNRAREDANLLLVAVGAQTIQ